MKEVGILTLHFYENFGSVLQAYALKTAIEKRYGCDAEIINYRPKVPEYRYFKEFELNEKYEDKKLRFREFRKRHLLINEDERVSQIEHIGKDYDILIVGSDQVWNPDITRLNTAYFFDGAGRESVKASYAASLAVEGGHMTLDEGRLKELLANLDYISVREMSSELYLKRLTGREVLTVADPTFLLAAEDYHGIIPERVYIEEPYLLFYFLTHDTAAIDWANLMAKKLGLQIVHYFADMPGRVFLPGARDFTFAGPEEFLWYVKNADLVFTNSFHGTVFSILFKRPFYTYTVRREMLSRAMDLTEVLGLKDRRLNTKTKLEEVTLEVDYMNVYKKILEIRADSFQFLDRVFRHGQKKE